LDDPQHLHPCNIDASYHGFELLLGMVLSSIEHRHIVLPLTAIPARAELVSLETALSAASHPIAP
jgi:hypothetical protein